MSKASEVVAIALSQVGYKEKASNKNLDDKTANAGSANYTKYARDLYSAGYYNGNKNGFAWCDVFVDWCFFKAYGAVEGQRIQCQTGDCGAGCTFSKRYYQAQGRCDKTPKVGDQVFFQQNGSITHTGIVVEVSGSTIKTAEGNSSNQVAQRTYSLSNSYVDSFGHPKYSETDSTVTATKATTETATAATENTTYTIHTVVRGDTLWGLARKYLGKGSRYPEIKRLNNLSGDTIFVGQKLKIPNK